MELKLHYAIDPTARLTRYQVEAYFFIPQTLGVNSYTYGREEFFADVHAYIRFRTPLHPLHTLADASNPDSALGRVHAALQDGERDEISSALRMLACLVRASSRDAVRGLVRRIERLQERPGEHQVLLDDLRRGVDSLVDVARTLLGRFRESRPVFLHPQSPSWQHELYEYTDEALSVFLEAHLTKLLAALDRSDTLREAVLEPRANLVALIIAEQNHRRAADYVTVVDSGRPDGAYVHRRGMLKKFISSVLFLELSKELEGQRLAQFGAAMAAGVAMLLSTVLAIWSQQVYGVNTFPFVVALVLGYMLKDRIKDWLKAYFSTKATRWLYDYSVRIYDPMSSVTVGRCRETFAFLSRARIPTAIWRCRHADTMGAIETENKREVVMRYVKDVALAGRRIDRRIARASDISDIVRLDVSRFLVRMDDAKQRVPVYDPDSDQIRTAKLPKRYHLNVVLVLQANRKVVQMERFRLVLDKNGIKELHQVAPTATAAAVAERRAGRALQAQRV
ncbi:MAG: hypothetical protein JKY37_03715 [Nannocystaceae bacterium]|nr:hypothetical protein [Nannocystaceae bacterium]